MSLERGLELVRAGQFFAAHEELEDAWREAPAAERDFLQGLVHVALAAGLSGHGFKFTSALGKILAQLVLDGHTPLPIEFLKLRA